MLNTRKCSLSETSLVVLELAARAESSCISFGSGSPLHDSPLRRHLTRTVGSRRRPVHGRMAGGSGDVWGTPSRRADSPVPGTLDTDMASANPNIIEVTDKD